jgi:hypothetical protein
MVIGVKARLQKQEKRKSEENKYTMSKEDSFAYSLISLDDHGMQFIERSRG